jgi:NADH-quinone oxidoreductase E subunit
MKDFEFTSENLEKLQLAIKKYPEGRAQSAIMDALYIAQEQEGWISPEAMKAIAHELKITKEKVREIATFYTMYFKQPMGKFVLQICGTSPCMLRGSHDLIEAVKQELSINEGETTPDNLFSLQEVECLGACANAPMMQINNKFYYEDLTIETIITIIRDIREGNLPKSGSFTGRKSAEPLKFI